VIEALRARSAASDAVLALLPASGAVRVAAPVQVVSLFHPRGDRRAGDLVSACGWRLPVEAGSTCGSDPCLIWRQPGETLAVSSTPKALDPLLARLVATPSAAAAAIDLSHAVIVFELNHRALDAWLSRLVDSSALPRAAGAAWRTRLGEVAVLVVRRSPEQAWLIADRALAHYLAQWLAYSHERILEID
jgi:sarcosine oxidase gamma subunit